MDGDLWMVTIVVTRRKDRRVQRAEWSTLYDRIRWLIDYRKVTQREFSEGAGQSAGYIGAYFTRVQKNRSAGAGTGDATINADVLAGIVRGWNVSAAWLLLGVGTPDEAFATIPAATFASSPRWGYLVTTALALEPSTPQWAFDVIAGWPAPPSTVALSVGLVLDLARVVMRYYPPSVEPSDDASGTRIKPFVAPPDAPRSAASNDRK